MINEKTQELAKLICANLMEDGADFNELAGRIATAAVLACRTLSNYTEQPLDWEESATMMADGMMQGLHPDTTLSEESLFYVRNYEDMFHNISKASGIILEHVITKQQVQEHEQEFKDYVQLINRADWFGEQIEARLKQQGYKYRMGNHEGEDETKNESNNQ